jgi:hypothetical protein
MLLRERICAADKRCVKGSSVRDRGRYTSRQARVRLLIQHDRRRRCFSNKAMELRGLCRHARLTAILGGIGYRGRGLEHVILNPR